MSARVTRTTAVEAIRHVEDRGARVIIDVRSKIEFEEECIEGSCHIPLEELVRRIDEILAIEGARLILCRSGKRAEFARQELERLGVSDLLVVDGGILAYRLGGGETLRGDR
ncbi:MAG: rhodanese-like domain-containing protein [Planctomycetes bacterium]|nr:rhodanese-like domain-containing protein [Planctomycetota bacterium]MCB9920432.1 rhodanese-like domain-containing protein [Planctomycetota bacterium]